VQCSQTPSTGMPAFSFTILRLRSGIPIVSHRPNYCAPLWIFQTANFLCNAGSRLKRRFARRHSDAEVIDTGLKLRLIRFGLEGSLQTSARHVRLCFLECCAAATRTIRQVPVSPRSTRPKSYGELAAVGFRFLYSMCCIEPSLQFLIIIYYAAEGMVIA
jgi:hypothetical protein